MTAASFNGLKLLYEFKIVFMEINCKSSLEIFNSLPSFIKLENILSITLEKIYLEYFYNILIFLKFRIIDLN